MMVERFVSTLRSFERMLEVEESDAYQAEGLRLKGSSPANPAPAR